MYSPRSLEINFASIWFAVLTRVRSAPTTTPPDGSLTVPPKLALPICADAETTKTHKIRKAWIDVHSCPSFHLAVETVQNLVFAKPEKLPHPKPAGVRRQAN